MNEPTSAGKRPIVMDVEAGDYWWCACGRSETAPFCDGSHKGTGLGPTKFTITEKRKVAFCDCKRTSEPPFCDGSHSKS